MDFKKVTKYAIKIEKVHLFFAKGTWKFSIEDATKFDSIEDAKKVAASTKKEGLIIVSVQVNQQVRNVL